MDAPRGALNRGDHKGAARYMGRTKLCCYPVEPGGYLRRVNLDQTIAQFASFYPVLISFSSLIVFSGRAAGS